MSNMTPEFPIIVVEAHLHPCWGPHGPHGTLHLLDVRALVWCDGPHSHGAQVAPGAALWSATCAHHTLPREAKTQERADGRCSLRGA
jgi:hypothetical protein